MGAGLAASNVAKRTFSQALHDFAFAAGNVLGKVVRNPGVQRTAEFAGKAGAVTLGVNSVMDNFNRGQTEVAEIKAGYRKPSTTPLSDQPQAA